MRRHTESVRRQRLHRGSQPSDQWVGGELGLLLGERAADALGQPVVSYGKGGVAGLDGEQEHVNTALTSVFGNAFRKAVGGSAAWITSTTKIGGRSHYDTVEVRVPGAPRSNELVIIVAVSNRGRINARVGGKTIDEARER